LYPCNDVICSLCSASYFTETNSPPCPLCGKEIDIFENENERKEEGEREVVVWPTVGILEEREREGGVVVTETDFIHYGCMRDNDGGWGCAYRCLQMILSNYSLSHSSSSFSSSSSPSSSSSSFALFPPTAMAALTDYRTLISSSPNSPPHSSRWMSLPSIKEIQIVLASLGRIPERDIGSRRWIEPPDAGAYVRR